MSCYVYKYVENEDDVVYVGKVTAGEFTDLVKRHKQHTKDDWYDIKMKMYYIEFPFPADADIVETYFISKYNCVSNTENKAKQWGKCSISISNKLDWVLFDCSKKAIDRKTTKDKPKTLNNCPENLSSFINWWLYQLFSSSDTDELIVVSAKGVNSLLNECTQISISDGAMMKAMLDMGFKPSNESLYVPEFIVRKPKTVYNFEKEILKYSLKPFKLDWWEKNDLRQWSL